MKFSLIICTHNVPQKLSKTLDSILVQTYSDFEGVMIDGDRRTGRWGMGGFKRLLRGKKQ